MSSEEVKINSEEEEVEVEHGGGSNAVYGIGLIGAWVYYFRRATNFQEYVLAFLKGLAWPAVLVYELLVFLKKE